MATQPVPVEIMETGAEERAPYVPEGYEDAAEFLEEARRRYREDRDADRPNLEAAADDLRFAALDQWDPQELRDRETLGQPSITVDMLNQIIAQVVGDWRANEVAIKVLPREDSDVDIAQIREDLIRAIETQSNAPQVYSRAFTHEATCGIGHFRVDLDYADNDVFDRDIFIRGITNPLSVTWDYMSVDPTGKDAEHCFVEDILPRRTFEKRWPDVSPSDLGDKAYTECRVGEWLTVDTVRVTEYWRVIRRPRTLAMMQDGSTLDVTDMAPEQWADKVYNDNGTPLVRVVQRKYAQMHFITGFAILEGPFELPIDRIPIFRCLGKVVPVGDFQSRMSLIRPAKDSQRLNNYWVSVMAEVLSKAPRQQWIGPADAFEGYEQDFREAHLNGDPILRFKRGASSPPVRVQQPEVPAAFMQQAQLMRQYMKDSTGQHDASFGMQGNETSGVAIQARQSQGDISTMEFTDNMASAIMECGSVVNQLIPVTHDRARTARLVGPDGEARLMRINDPMDPNSPDLSKGRFDVVISTGPAYLTRRQESLNALIEIIRVAPQIASVAGDLLVKAIDSPDAEEIAERLENAMPANITGKQQPETPPTPQQQQAQQMQQEAIQLQQRKLNAEVMEAEAKAQEAQARARQADAQAAAAGAEASKADAEASSAHAETLTALIKTGHAGAELHAHHAHTLNALSGFGAPTPKNNPQSGNARAPQGSRPRRRK